MLSFILYSLSNIISGSGHILSRPSVEYPALRQLAKISVLCNEAYLVPPSRPGESDESTQSRLGDKVDFDDNVNIEMISTLLDRAPVEDSDLIVNGQFRPHGGYSKVGTATEAALIVLAEKIGLDSRQTPQIDVLPTSAVLQWQRDFRRLHLLEFSRDRKSMSVVVQQQVGPCSQTTGVIDQNSKLGVATIASITSTSTALPILGVSAAPLWLLCKVFSIT